MTAPGWVVAMRHGGRVRLRAPRLPRAHLTPGQKAALRRGLIVALCAILAGALSVHLRGATRDHLAPMPSGESARA